MAFDTRTKGEVVAELRESGIDAYPSISATTMIQSRGIADGKRALFPLSGVSKRTTVYCNEMRECSLYGSDEQGFNNPSGLYANEAIDVALLGDLSALGACVPPNEDVAGQLRRLGIRALNLGNDGGGALTKLATLEEYARVLKPKTLLWFYSEQHGLSDLSADLSSEELKRYLNEGLSQNLFERRTEVNARITSYVDRGMYREQHQNDSGVAVAMQLGQLRRSWRAESLVHRFGEILAEAKKRTRSWGGELVFIYIPAGERYTQMRGNKLGYQRDRVLQMLKRLELPVVDFYAVLAGKRNPSSFYPFRMKNQLSVEV